MRKTASRTTHSNTPMVIRENTAKLNPIPKALHLMASGVVDQIRMMDTKANGTDIWVSL